MPLIHPMAAFWLWFSITVVPVAHPVPVAVSGVVVHATTGTPVPHAEIDLVWSAGPFFVDRSRRLGQTESGADGRFEVHLDEGPITQVRVRTRDEAYRGHLEVAADRQSDQLTIEVRPSIAVAGGVSWKGDFSRLAAVVNGLLVDHVPGTPPPTATLREHFEAGRIAAVDLEYLAENQETFSGVSLHGFGPPPGQARVLWGRREMEYGAVDDPLRFLSSTEIAGRNLRAAAETGDEEIYRRALAAAFVAEGAVTEETLGRWRDSGLIRTAWQEEMARWLSQYPVLED